MSKRATYKKIRVSPMTTALGAEVEGVDLSRPMDKATREEVFSAFHEHLLLLFRDQKLDPHSLGRFATLFGPPTLGLSIPPGRVVPYVTELTREAHVPSSVPVVGDTWHSDQSMRERPSMGFTLYCTEAPDYGSDTLFTSLHAAYDALSDTMKSVVDRLTLIHSASGRFGRDGSKLGGYGPGRELTDPERLKLINAEMEHPLVRVHPVTGKKLLFVNGVYTIRVAGMTDEESKPLLAYLNDHVTRPEFTCRIRWRAGTLMLADNRSTLHRALNDYHGFRRHMLRVEMEGDRPFGPAMPKKEKEPKKEREKVEKVAKRRSKAA